MKPRSFSALDIVMLVLILLLMFTAPWLVADERKLRMSEKEIARLKAEIIDVSEIKRRSESIHNSGTHIRAIVDFPPTQAGWQSAIALTCDGGEILIPPGMMVTWLISIPSICHDIWITGERIKPQPKPVGWIDGASCTAVTGWAWDAQQPNTPVRVNLYESGGVTATIIADIYREDLVAAGIGNGYHGFRFIVPSYLKDGTPHLFSASISGRDIQLSEGNNIVNCMVPKPQPKRAKLPVGHPPIPPKGEPMPDPNSSTFTNIYWAKRRGLSQTAFDESKLPPPVIFDDIQPELWEPVYLLTPGGWKEWKVPKAVPPGK